MKKGRRSSEIDRLKKNIRRNNDSGNKKTLIDFLLKRKSNDDIDDEDLTMEEEFEELLDDEYDFETNETLKRLFKNTYKINNHKFK
jgi:hypothetical protein